MLLIGYRYGGFVPAEDRPAHFIVAALMTLPVIILIIWSAYKLISLYRRETKIRKFIRAAGKSDPLWNEKQMIQISKEIFQSVQTSWSKNKFKSIAPLLTDELKLEWIEVWEGMKQMDFMFYCSISVIHDVLIVGAEDYEDDSKDTFTIEISATVRRYIYHRPSSTIEPNHTIDLQHVTDVYTFVRNENTWLLNKIENNIGFKNLSKYKIIKE